MQRLNVTFEAVLNSISRVDAIMQTTTYNKSSEIASLWNLEHVATFTASWIIVIF